MGDLHLIRESHAKDTVAILGPCEAPEVLPPDGRGRLGAAPFAKDLGWLASASERPMAMTNDLTFFHDGWCFGPFFHPFSHNFP